jgi:CheY-like chemotaxis protein
MRFLVIDDSSVDRHLLVSLLEELGHQVDTVNGPEGALEEVANGDYHSVFLDVVMPTQDGYRFLRALRSHPSTAKQHVILYSSKTTDLEIKYGLNRAGANQYLTKPATRETISEVLQKVLV